MDKWEVFICKTCGYLGDIHECRRKNMILREIVLFDDLKELKESLKDWLVKQILIDIDVGLSMKSKQETIKKVIKDHIEERVDKEFKEVGL